MVSVVPVAVTSRPLGDGRRDGLRRILLDAGDIEVVGETGDGREALHDLRASTVSTHLQRIKTALALSTNSELAQYALRAGIVAWEGTPRR